MNKIQIIRATLDHIEIITPLFDDYRQFYGQSTDLEGARHFLSQRLQQNQSILLLALQGTNGIGFTQLYPAFSSVAMRPIWILNDLFVAESARHRRVATRLIEEAKRLAAESNVARLVLATAADNRPAQSLYEKLGWVRDRAFIHYKCQL